MAFIKPFKAIRPKKTEAKDIAALPYDVYNRKEAKEAVIGKPLSFLNIDRPETQFDADVDMYSDEVYQKAHDLFWELVRAGHFIQDDKPCYYIYELTMNMRRQTGIVACASIDEYESGVIKKHENTRAEKEKDRIRHVEAVCAQTGPIFLAYRENKNITDIVNKKKMTQPEYDFTADDGVRHRVWVIDDVDSIEAIYSGFKDTADIYIADGHHRAASAVKVGLKRRAENEHRSGDEEYNFFLSVLFPDSELMIMDYNRVIKDLGKYTEEEFLAKVKELFEVKECNRKSPERKGMVTMYLKDKWYEIDLGENKCPNDPVKSMDVSRIQDMLFEPVLGIKDPKSDKRIDFVGGIRGLTELERRVNTDCKVAFAMYPTSIDELFAVADAHLLMPPKSTWFEPKLRSGIFIHKI